jgi:hypothetical protein
VRKPAKNSSSARWVMPAGAVTVMASSSTVTRRDRSPVRALRRWAGAGGRVRWAVRVLSAMA